MPNRIIREGILTSQRVNSLDWSEEVFFRRLLSVVDDYGRCEAHPALLRASLYPLQLDKVREVTVEKFLAATVAARLVQVYTVDEKRFLQVLNFRQQTRSSSKCPAPGTPDPVISCAADAQQMPETKSAAAQRLPEDAHLGVSVSVVGGVSVSVSGADGPGQTDDQQQRKLTLNALFNRRPTTAWSADELKAFRAAGLDRMSAEQFSAEASAVVAFYQAEISESLARKFWRRTEMIRVLRHWPSEVDRAGKWAEHQEKIASVKAEGRL